VARRIFIFPFGVTGGDLKKDSMHVYKIAKRFMQHLLSPESEIPAGKQGYNLNAASGRQNAVHPSAKHLPQPLT
jgi:hypothetical protein